MPYVAITDIVLNNYDFKPGDVIPEEKMRGYYPSTLTRLGFAKFVPEAQPVAPTPKTEASIPEKEIVYSDETVEAGPAKAVVEKRGVWFQVFVNDKKVFNSRNEKEAEKFAEDFNART